ncbi:hypothetical protein LCGC14_0412670 [marine sediment metagenome]|uniref:phosphoribosylglycinamide formyltransferase 1 n=1 Tax=marine sediment metagenome TaxID=412755 RepID=A0A0F9VFI1_9ZZZZ
MNLAIFLSGAGSNFLAIHEAIKVGRLDARIALVVGNNVGVQGLRVAHELGLYTLAFDRIQNDRGRLQAEIQKRDVDLIVLAGFLRKLRPDIIRAYPRRIVNIHPSLLPKYGGKGMYGLNVHRAVIAAGETETGVTVHYVDEQYDHGEIIDQCAVPVLGDDTPETLAARVLAVEHVFYSAVLQRIGKELADG